MSPVFNPARPTFFRSHVHLEGCIFTLVMLLRPMAHAADYSGKALFDCAMPFAIFLGLDAICVAIEEISQGGRSR